MCIFCEEPVVFWSVPVQVVLVEVVADDSSLRQAKDVELKGM
jgi:hypothetical protein